jgi:small subunit ribosomal protein S19
MPREFRYRGYSLKELREMSMDDFIQLLPSRRRRSLLRVPSEERRKLMRKLRKAQKAMEGGKELTVKTHCRDAIIFPEMIGLTIYVHNGKEFVPVEITPIKIGHLLGEYAITNKKVTHGTPGIGASKSSMYVPLR